MKFGMFGNLGRFHFSYGYFKIIEFQLDVERKRIIYIRIVVYVISKKKKMKNIFFHLSFF